MARCTRCHGCRSQWDVNNCPYCNYPDPMLDDDKENYNKGWVAEWLKAPVSKIGKGGTPS